GSYPQAAGKNIANPFGSILSAAMLLEHCFNLQDEATAIRSAVKKAILSGYVTEDIGFKNNYPTTSVAEFVSEQITKPATVS
ncbi:MAG: isocitrate/isopropylmalate family dehydrogenase, partial [Fulvivirga sp.]|nr:isocitrate/isopropylmalate family dehydrogenase [Fulvivirga sp.]